MILTKEVRKAGGGKVLTFAGVEPRDFNGPELVNSVQLTEARIDEGFNRLADGLKKARRRVQFATSTSEVPNLLLAGMQTIFLEALAIVPHRHTEVCSVIQSTKAAEPYAWLQALPRMSEFLDDRKIRRLRENTYTITNRTWEATIGVDRAAIEDDQLGAIKLRVQQLADSAMRHRDELVFGAYNLAFSATQLGYDGLALCHDAHPVGAATADNKGTTALSSAAITTAISQQRRITDEEGRPIYFEPGALIVPPELEWTAREILASAMYPDLVTVGNQKLSENPLKGLMSLVVSPDLTDTNNWFITDTSKPVRPVILQVRMESEMEALEGQSEAGFLRDEYLYGVRDRKAVGLGLWQFCFGAEVA